MIDVFSTMDLGVPHDIILSKVAAEFQLGSIDSYVRLRQGLFGISYKLVTDCGQYFVKVFSPEKGLQRTRSITGAIQSMYRRGLPVPRIFSSTEGVHHFTIQLNGSGSLYGCVLSWVEGENFTETEPSCKELGLISKSLAAIHDLTIEVVEHYDWWFPTNLPRECMKKLEYVTRKKHVRCITEAVTQFRAMNVAELSTGVVHGDLSRQNVLKSGADICIVDFDALNVGSLVTDLAVAMSHFCVPLDGSCEQEFLERFDVMLKEYLSRMRIFDYEIGILPTLLRATYAMYLVQGTHVYRVLGQQSGVYWIELGERGLDLVGRLDDRAFFRRTVFAGVS